MHIHTDIHTYLRTYVTYMHADMNKQTSMHAYMHEYIHAYILTDPDKYMQVHTNTPKYITITCSCVHLHALSYALHFETLDLELHAENHLSTRSAVHPLKKPRIPGK